MLHVVSGTSEMQSYPKPWPAPPPPRVRHVTQPASGGYFPSAEQEKPQVNRSSETWENV